VVVALRALVIPKISRMTTKGEGDGPKLTRNRNGRSPAVFWNAAGNRSCPGQALKVETRVQIPLGLRTHTCWSQAKSGSSPGMDGKNPLAADSAVIPRDVKTERRRLCSADTGPCPPVPV
jgi:hypothetical protein